MDKARKKWKDAEIKHLKALITKHGFDDAIPLHQAKYGRTAWAIKQKGYQLKLGDAASIPNCIQPILRDKDGYALTEIAVNEPPIQWSMFIIGLAIGLGIGLAAFGVGL